MTHIARKLSQQKLILGVVHLLPLSGSPRAADQGATLDRAVSDAKALAHAGIDGVIVENFGDAPFRKDRVDAVTVAEMTRMVLAVREVIGDGPLLGVNVLRNDARAALSIAHACGAHFIRVNVHTGVMMTDQGVIEGCADETLRLKRQLASDVDIFADVAVKHASPPFGFDLQQSARDTALRGLADALIVTGSGTGATCNVDELRSVRRAVPNTPVFVGSGCDVNNVAEVLRTADGVIVGTALKRDGHVEHPVCSNRTAALIRAARA